MADKTQINLERIRACDAEWEESKHPRSENGQFTSGSGAHVSKIQSGGKAKVQQLKNVSGALAGVNAKIEKADNTFAARMDRTRKAAKNNGGLESYKYKPPSKLEGFPIVMASKKTNSGLGGGNRFKFGFKKYKDGIMIRYVDDYWDSSDYAFVPLKNPTLENAYSYSDNASSKTVSALKDSLVTNEELGKIARQLK